VKNDSEAIVVAKNLSKHFPAGGGGLAGLLTGRPKKVLRAVDGVSLEVRRGETFALVGESGCGKSTLARLLAGLYTPTSGSLVLFGEDVSSGKRSRALTRRLNMIFQDPYASLNPRWRIGDIVAEPLRVQHAELGEAEIARRVTEALDLVGLPADAVSKYPHQFSGGQRQRISIARVLSGAPELVICDEPTSALDVSVQAQVLNLMKELQQRRDMTYLFISHNLAVVHHMADRIGVMYLGRIVEIAEKKALFAEPLHPYTRMLLDAIPRIGEKGRAHRTPVAGEVPSPLDPPSGCTFHPRCPRACERCSKEAPLMRAVKTPEGLRFVACHMAGK
jgi:peptide/nickel transport system ATP-binding protein